MNAPPFNLEAVNEATAIAMQAGHRLLQTHLFGDSDAVHTDFLYLMMGTPNGAHILDAGCGIGEVPRILAELEPSLTFDMLNLSEMQLMHCPEGPRFNSTHGDCHSMPYPDCHFDVVMFNSALCQMDADLALAEAARVLRDGGTLFINDMAAKKDLPADFEQLLGARALSSEEMMAKVKNAGFITTLLAFPVGSDAHFRDMLTQAGRPDLIDGIVPMMIRAHKYTLES